MIESRESDLHWLKLAIELSRNCAKTDKSFAVGAVVLDWSGQLVSTGFSLELGPGWHAEEAALHKAAQQGADLQDGTIYSSLEPCSTRLSGNRCCADLIAEAGIRRVVFALKEPPIFVNGAGMAVLLQRGVNVTQLQELGPEVEEINRHLLARET